MFKKKRMFGTDKTPRRLFDTVSEVHKGDRETPSDCIDIEKAFIGKTTTIDGRRYKLISISNRTIHSMSRHSTYVYYSYNDYGGKKYYFHHLKTNRFYNLKPI